MKKERLKRRTKSIRCQEENDSAENRNPAGTVVFRLRRRSRRYSGPCCRRRRRILSCAQEIPTVNFSPMLSFREADVFSEKDLHRQTEDRQARTLTDIRASAPCLSSDDFLRKPHFCGLPRIRRFFDLSVFRRRKNGCLRRLFSPRLPHARRDRYLIMIRSS